MIKSIIQGKIPQAKRLIIKEQKERLRGKQGYIFYNTRTGMCIAKVYIKGCEPEFPQHFVEVCRFKIGSDPDKVLSRWTCATAN